MPKTAVSAMPKEPWAGAIKWKLGDTVLTFRNRDQVILDTQAKVDCFNSHGDIYPILLRDECLVRIEKPERMTVTKRLWIPDSAQREDYELYVCTILTTGPGRRRKDGRINPMEVKTGDKILAYFHGIEAKGATKFDWNGEECRILAEWQMQAILES